MHAIILAAGMGKRLKELTRYNTKCMIKVNGITLIERMLKQIDQRHFSRIVIVVGYEGKKLVDFVGSLEIRTPILFVENKIYDRTNNIYSLSLVKDQLCREDTILFESDLIFEDAVLDLLLQDPRDTLALVDGYEAWMDGTCVKVDERDQIVEFSSQVSLSDAEEYYKTVNIYKFSKGFSATYYIPFMEAYLQSMGENEYYEQVLRVIAMLDKPAIQVKKLSGQKWYEIDDAQDLDIAESLFPSDDSENVKMMAERYGGFWRYPKMLDFCYLVNPYFPTQRMKDEMKASFNELLTEYPSGMRVNSVLAGNFFDVHRENIVIGNGASELIKSIMESFSGSTGFVRPAFDEYINRCGMDRAVVFEPGNPDFSYDTDDLIRFFSDKAIENLIIVNPDNPSGNYIPKGNILRLVQWCKEKNIRVVIDESFVDFSDEENASLLQQEYLSDNPHLYVIKSISKSYGVPGIRIGILASGNIEKINETKKRVAIWNINSFGEFFMQLLKKYKTDYQESLSKLREERNRFQEELGKIPGVRVIPSQANFVMIETDVDVKKLSGELLNGYNLLVKELSDKTERGNYLRLAVRTEEDNNRLLKALYETLGNTVDHR